MTNDVIAAIATAPATGAIGVVRLSGRLAVDVFTKMFQPAGKQHGNFESHRMYYGRIINAAGDTVDEVMACFMRAPRSFTREDVVEIYGHGGIFVLRAVLDTAIACGARLAEPGEFTKRAFLNGRINLAEAEAVMDIIHAHSESARRAGLRQLGGGLSRRIEGLQDKILTWIAHIELSIDYPEHEEEAQNAKEILSQGHQVIAEMEALKATANVGRILREGVKTAIIGRPNVGKSTLLNAMLSEDRAIVHETAGTTRDVLTEQVVAGDVHLVLMDTAGIRSTADPIEQIGVEKSLAVADAAELVLYVIDGQAGFPQNYSADNSTDIPEALTDEMSQTFSHTFLLKEDMDILEGILHKHVIILLNKSDLFNQTAAQNAVPMPRQLSDHTHDKFPAIKISAQTGQGLDELYQKINDIFLSGNIGSTDAEQDILTRERHRILIDNAIRHVATAMQEIRNGTPEDLVSINLRTAYAALNEILGREIADDIADKIFAEFCLGK